MKILFITHEYPNYVPDLLLHGLRKLFGSDVVEYPKKRCLYEGILGLGVCPEDQKAPGWFPEDRGDIDRTDIFNKIRSGFFTYVVCDIRSLSFLSEQLKGLPQKLILIDGEDLPAYIKPGPYVICRRETNGTDYSIPLPMSLPEEIFSWITSYDHIPKRYTIGFLGSSDGGIRSELIENLKKIYPNTLFQATPIPSSEDKKPIGRFSRDQYYRSLQECRIVLSLVGKGDDTFRFWENSAFNAVHLFQKLKIMIPEPFIEGTHSFSFLSFDELRIYIDECLRDVERASDMTVWNRYHLVNHHLTTHRATYFLDRVTRAFKGPQDTK